ncbi:MAG: GAF domain-containing protein, partial [Herminiimonas sp.]|nr:GAF domain-containing protein [Herminiimonas sp.]
MATILIVDDHAINRQFLLTLLGYGGHRLLEAAEGAQALELARIERPDLVITDVLMPNMDGYELVTGMRADQTLAHVPVIFYTASYRAREARSMAQACGVKWVLSKPSEPELILQTVQEALGSSQQSDNPAAPRLSASIGDDEFSSINHQLAHYLNELADPGDPESASLTGSAGGLPVSDRERLHGIATRMADSVTSLQAVSTRLTRLVELGLDLAAERDPARMLEILCRAAHGVCAAKHAAVAILDGDGIGLGFCFARGMGNEIIPQLRAMAPRAGVLGRLIDERIPSRLNRLGGDPAELGLPPSHPPVHSFLGVPIASKEHTYGWLYLADKLDDGDFSEVDEQIAATIAFQMAAAYENVILYDEVHQHRAQLQMEVVERKQAQEALRRNLRARTVMAQCNRVLMHATDETGLLDAMCTTIVETGNYPLVWIGYVDALSDAALKVMASAGVEADIKKRLGAEVAIDFSTSVAGTAIRTAQPYMVGDTANYPDVEQLPMPVAARDYRSALALPLKEGEQVIGALTIYESEPNAFSRHQIEMLQQLADDISYGAASLRTKRAREQAERSLLAAQEQLTDILNSIDNIVWSISKGEFLYISPVAEKVFGYPLSAFYQDKMLWMNAIHPDDQPVVKASIGTLHDKGAVTREYRIYCCDGSVRWLEDRTRAVRDAHGRLLRFDGVASDITHRKDYEERIEYLATHDPLTGLANRNLLR